ncbi:MAG: tetratricopeptide repeat protein [Candidatus Sumerlaeota bacterium]|nr:tetratricopeptide repeat protein [Candidatus Sumerlaeota bacterium]
MMASSAYQNGRWEEAIARYSELCRDKALPDEQRFWALSKLERCQRKLGRTDQALAILDEIKAQFENSEAVWTGGHKARTIALSYVYGERCDVFHQAKRYDEELECLRLHKESEVAFSQEVQSPTPEQKVLGEMACDSVDLGIAECLVNLGRLTEAGQLFHELQSRMVSHLKQLEAFEPDNLSAYLTRTCEYYGRVYIPKRLGDCTGDRSYYEEALAKYPTGASAEALKEVPHEHLVEKSGLERLIKERPGQAASRPASSAASLPSATDRQEGA